MNIADAPRLKTAQAVLALADRLHAGEGDAVVTALASAALATSEAAMGTVLVKAGELSATLDAFNWEILDAVGRLTDERRAEAAEVARIIREALASDEHAARARPSRRPNQKPCVCSPGSSRSPRP